MINMDFQKKIEIQTSKIDWQSSPADGVWRKPLAREDAEQGHATSIVRYDAGSSFEEHKHPKGEEILVLQGVFSDEHGDYPEGYYLRNPSGTSHAPSSAEGCILFVKLYQFDDRDEQQLAIDTNGQRWLPGKGRLEVMPLHSFENEYTALVKCPAGEPLTGADSSEGEELLILSGLLVQGEDIYPAGTWMRNPTQYNDLYAEEDSIVFVKVGHIGS